jgi:hypothetical protein
MEEPDNEIDPEIGLEIGLAAQKLERRGMPRCTVDEEASLLLLSHGSALPGRMVELSLGGCRIVLRQRTSPSLHAAVEAVFKIRGIAFRLSGVTEWTTGGSVGISFGAMSSRRRDDLMEVLCEVEAENAAEALKEAAGVEDTGMAPPTPINRVPASQRPQGTSSFRAWAGKNPQFPAEEKTGLPANGQEQPTPAASGRKFRLLDFVFRRARGPGVSTVPENPTPAAGASAARAANQKNITQENVSQESGLALTAEAGTASQPLPGMDEAQRKTPPESSAQPAAAEGAPSRRDRRSAPRCEIDNSAVIFLVKIGSKLAGQILDLSLGGCRIRTAQRFPVGIYTRVEIEFQVQGLPLRLGGVIQAIYDRHVVGIRFLDVSPRKREQIAELIEEIGGTQAASSSAVTGEDAPRKS